MANPFYINPNPTGVDIGGQLAQLGQTLGNVRRQDEQKQQQQQATTQLQQAIASGDPDRISDVVIANPNISEQQRQAGYQRMGSIQKHQQDAQMQSTFKLLAEPQNGHKIMADHISDMVQQGATKEQIQPYLHELGAYDKDPKAYMDHLNIKANISYPQQYKSFKAMTQPKHEYEQGTGKAAGFTFDRTTGGFTANPKVMAAIQQQAQQKAKQARATNTQLKPSDVSTINTNLNNQILKQPVGIWESANALKNLRTSSSPASQKAAVVHFLKSLDPTGVVRDTEEGMVYSSGGKFPQLEGEINDLFKGGKLAPKVFQDLVETSKNLANSSLDSAREASGEYLNTYGDLLSDNRRKAFMKRVPKNFQTDRLYDGSKYVKPNAVVFTSNNPNIGAVTEEDIHATMKAKGLNRQQVIERLGGK